MLNKYKIRVLQVFFILTGIIGISVYGFSGLFTILIVYIVLEVFAGNATLHRYYCHRSFKMAAWKERILCWLSHHIGIGSVLGWGGYHRWHHMHSDTEKDLHSPTVQGIPHVLFGVWDANIPRSMVKDLLSDDKLVWWHRNYYKYHVIVIISLMLISPWTLVYVYAIPNLFSLLSAYAIAILPHRTSDVKNDLLTEVLTLGEGWHKYHHDNPTHYRYNAYDITGLAIHYLLKERE